MWMDDPSCFDVVHNGWNLPVTSSPLFKLNARIKNVKKALQTWNAKQFGSCQNKISDISEQIKSVQALDKTASNLAIDVAL